MTLGRNLLVAALFLSSSGLVVAQQAAQQPAQPPARQSFPMAASILRGYHGVQRNLAEAAEKMPEADYSFKPRPEMRPFSQLVSHVALSQFGTCSLLKGQPDPHKDDKEENIKTKSEAVALLKASTALCDQAFEGLTDQSMVEMVSAPQNDLARGLAVTGTNSHGNEMYGTMSVYLRLKGLVPPTTERAEAAKKEAEAKKAQSGK
jgi:uncharacterized damage-inducible protein DinB